MSDAAEYTLRWRGKQLGPFSLAEINRKLDEHEIGMGHEILDQDQWISLEQFFSAQKGTDPRPLVRVVPKTSSPQPNMSAPVTRSPYHSADHTAHGLVTPAETNAARALDTGSVERPRRRWIYAVLAVLLGFLGLHNYYARHWLTGLLQLLLSVATYLLGFGIIAPWLWAMVEAVVVRKDGHGLEMT